MQEDGTDGGVAVTNGDAETGRGAADVDPTTIGPPPSSPSSPRRSSDGIPMSMMPRGNLRNDTTGVQPPVIYEEDAGDRNEEHVDDTDGSKSNKSKRSPARSGRRQNTNGDARHDAAGPTFGSLLRKKLFASCRCCCGCCGCGCCRDSKGGKKKRAPLKRRAYNCCAFTLWIFPIFLGLYVTIVNIGSTIQGEVVRDRLPGVNKKLYATMDEGPVCAYNEQDNDRESIQPITFPDKEAAHDAGYLVLHCGACGACSDWHNLRLEYTTREFLAKESARCARKSIFGGATAVQECLEAPEPINFLGKCAECWTTDILCTKKHCTFIFLQSILINTVSNFKVNNDTITAASCEEANCEVGAFVPCSGATRRRMNVTSSIQRPGAQRCSIVDVSWRELFPE